MDKALEAKLDQIIEELGTINESVAAVYGRLEAVDQLAKKKANLAEDDA
ncbi:hypothetical protein V5S96_10170 [Corynebacterium mastitidis]|uniref:Peptide chain release factor 1 n=1 Tax=Corynebacterium mastitidis TaxID=161890 RepID=A0ABU8P2J2_9CORY